MSAGRPRSRQSSEEAQLTKRQQIASNVRVRFARFGDEVLAIVLSYAMSPKRMPALLSRLGVRALGEIETQIEAVWTFVADNGTWEFLRRVKAKAGKDDEAMAANLLDDEILMSRQQADAEEASVVEAPPDEPEAPSPPHERSPRLPPPRPGFIDTPQYKGPERRSGLDRRSHEDRRADIDAVHSNRRYGADRRKRPKGRRKSDT
jgi:type IV secretory pathway VirB10-like protein